MTRKEEAIVEYRAKRLALIGVRNFVNQEIEFLDRLIGDHDHLRAAAYYIGTDGASLEEEEADRIVETRGS